jgi:hypothetical protein
MCRNIKSLFNFELPATEEEKRLQEVEGPGTNDGLRAALHPQLAAEIIDVPLDRVHAQHQAARDLAVGGPFQQQAQHLALALSERFGEPTGASGGKRKDRGVLLVEGSEQGGDIIRDDATCIRQTQQDQHRCALIDKEADVALLLGEQERPLQGGQSAPAIPECFQGQCTQFASWFRNGC